ncbi:leucyl/phenylalanyl-tRNA--protein transferase [Alkalilimnicola ehrlichii MLHE-1]|uniref:Leucyl/phenylalanyl-tRNA--protein transferase n=1 Tax=Alkalilimnicola ehrlichii (strain ATCC BAA-1101 / DSM 17681 / MLHE-1) TaxID=187272 RepID=LFTR_ALKEH|nr:RecName: Full=Leucyl/phenylalanyl-tRNA--protein transferase; AltName: Full=L/F-transferase; AltName: Full=Leucyltransferase; AltName: Full=Phenyalanyltransferase [Alkalilimnicola ehrlichii MLHE-1]ABI57059.1 Leucyltransferase [Alkalilimnicola ehrlichii MLHE-1]
MYRLYWLDEHNPRSPFPPAEQAMDEPNGLLAVGGDLSPVRLEQAYRRGIFPWYGPGQPILWWSPDPRCIFRPGWLHVSRRLARRLRTGAFRMSLDTDFTGVISACAAPREDQAGTWIVPEMMHAYEALFELGIAHSVECWDRDGELVGGLYGVALSGAFFGESMFSRRSDASKACMAWLSAQLHRWGFALFDCQVSSPHLRRMGAVDVSRSRFLAQLQQALVLPHRRGPWRFDRDLDPVAIHRQHQTRTTAPEVLYGS